MNDQAPGTAIDQFNDDSTMVLTRASIEEYSGLDHFQPDAQASANQGADTQILPAAPALQEYSRGHLESNLHQLTVDLSGLEDRLLEKSARIHKFENEYRLREAHFASLPLQLELAQASVNELERENNELQARLDAVTAAHAALEMHLATVAADHAQALHSQQSLLEVRNHQLTALNEQVASDQVRFASLQNAESQLQKKYQTATDTCASLEKELHGHLGMIRWLNENLDQARCSHEQATIRLKAAEEKNVNVEAELQQRTEKIRQMVVTESALQLRTQTLSALLQERDELIGRLESDAARGASLMSRIQRRIEQLELPEVLSTPHPATHMLVQTDGVTQVVHTLTRQTVIGRGENCQVQIDADSVSRRHALLVVNGSEAFLEDLDSTNGVYVNGGRISHQILSDGDVITIGTGTFHYAFRPVIDNE